MQMDKRSNTACSRTINRVLGVTLLALTFGAGVSAQAEEDRRVRIINETKHTMMRFYASNVGQTSWEEDILGQSTLAPGSSVVINIDDGSGYCLYDFKGVFDDGDEVIQNRIDVCQIESFRFTEN
jgi:hypothetical protein